MTVRNFSIKSRIDGRNTILQGGPKSLDGGFETEIYIKTREEKDIVATIIGTCNQYNILSVEILLHGKWHISQNGKSFFTQSDPK